MPREGIHKSAVGGLLPPLRSLEKSLPPGPYPPKGVYTFILRMWIRNPIVKCQELTSYHAKTCGRRNNGGIGGKRGWPWIDEREDDEDINCPKNQTQSI